MTILITGSSGFIGRHLTKYLTAKGYECLTPDIDVCMINESGLHADTVIHLAARALSSDFVNDPTGSYRTNVMGTLSVLEFCRINNARLIYLSTAAVYCPKDSAIIEEDPAAPSTPYGLSKYMGELLCERYSSDYGLSIITMRLFNIYGNGQNSYFLLSYLMSCLRTKEEAVIRSPDSIRDFMHVDDLCRAIHSAVSIDLSGYMLLNIGYGRGIRILDIIETLKKVSPTQFDYILKNDIAADTFYANTKKAERILGFSPKIAINEGLQRMLPNG